MYPAEAEHHQFMLLHGTTQMTNNDSQGVFVSRSQKQIMNNPSAGTEPENGFWFYIYSEAKY
jgi:hypothetical protein